MRLYDVLEDLCEIVTNKLADATKKIHSSGNLSVSDFDYLDKMTHTLKSIKTTMAMIGADGTFADEKKSYLDDYQESYVSNHERLLIDLKEMMPDAPDDQTKQEMRQLINRLERL
jgi:hypothetical protein